MLEPLRAGRVTSTDSRASFYAHDRILNTNPSMLGSHRQSTRLRAMLDKTKKVIKEQLERDSMESPVKRIKSLAEAAQDGKDVVNAIKEDVKEALKKKCE